MPRKVKVTIHQAYARTAKRDAHGRFTKQDPDPILEHDDFFDHDDEIRAETQQMQGCGWIMVGLAIMFAALVYLVTR